VFAQMSPGRTSHACGERPRCIIDRERHLMRH
jgi:hypothetical protein